MLYGPLKVGDKIKCIENMLKDVLRGYGYIYPCHFPLTIGKTYEIIDINLIKYAPRIGYDIIWDDNTTFTFLLGSDAAKFLFEMASQTTDIDYLELIKEY